MTTLEQQILDSLANLDAAVKTMSTATPKPNLLTFFQEIDQLSGKLPRDTDPSLLHYLHKKSYEKARLWLEGRNAENARGQCLRD
jgi:hypothetical protein